MSNNKQKEELKKELDKAMTTLESIMDATRGCGRRGQMHIDDHVKNINEIRKKLDLEPMDSPPCINDGTLGSAAKVLDIFEDQ